MNTQIIQTPTEWRYIRQTLKNNTLGFVPTMGNLHAGHESLLKRAKAENQTVALSIFVNPTQFNDPNDLKNYPRTLEADIAIAKKWEVDYVLIPKAEDLYLDQYRYRVVETLLSHQFCGAHRPGHFEGVLTVVLKLLLLVHPTKAYFGEKDFQQLLLIKEMVDAFFLDMEIIPCETVRDANGLALSSRNSRLAPEEYQKALAFPKLLASNQTCAEISQQLTDLGFIVDYIEEYEGRRLGAVTVGGVRLIDNTTI
jgi:pantoate--beta-alanine ligase